MSNKSPGNFEIILADFFWYACEVGILQLVVASCVSESGWAPEFKEEEENHGKWLSRRNPE